MSTNNRNTNTKTTMTYHSSAGSMVIVKKTKRKMTSTDENVEKRNPLNTIGRNINYYNHCINQYNRSPENLK